MIPCECSMVESVGENVIALKEGDLVIPTYLGECGECENCRSGKTNLCLEHPLTLNGLMLDGTSRMSIRGQRLYHLFSCSTWAEYMVVNANYLVKIDSRIGLSEASFLSCGFSTGYGAAWKAAKVEKGSSVAVLGLGAVGLGVCVVKEYDMHIELKFYKLKFLKKLVVLHVFQISFPFYTFKA